MPVTYNPIFVFVSSVIVIFAAYNMLEVSSKLSASTETSRMFWLVSGAITLGTGI